MAGAAKSGSRAAWRDGSAPPAGFSSGASSVPQGGRPVWLVGAMLFAVQLPRLRERVRPIYVRMGILPEVASGLQAAAELTRPPQE